MMRDSSTMKRKPPINVPFAFTASKRGCSRPVWNPASAARIIGDIKDPHSRISQMLHEHHDAIKVLKPESGTSPHVFYLGLDEAFVTPLMGRAQPALWQEV